MFRARNLLILLVFFVYPCAASATWYLPVFEGGVDPGLQTVFSPSVVYGNPGALALLEGSYAFASYAPNLAYTTVSRDPIDPDTGLPGGPLAFSETSFSSVYHDFLVSGGARFGSVVLALSVFTPNSVDSNASATGPLRYHLIHNRVFNLFVSPAVALRLHRKFMAGFGVGYVFTSIERSFMRDLSLRGESPLGSDAPVEAGGKGDELVRLGVRENSFVFFGGLLWRPRKWISVGLSYKSKVRALDRTNIQAAGLVSVTRWFDNTGWTELTGRAKLLTSFPDVLTAGVLVVMSRRLTLDFMLTWTRWSVLDKEMYRFSGNAFRKVEYSNWDVTFSRAVRMQDTLEPQITALWKWGPRFHISGALRFSPPAVKRQWVSPMQVDGYSVAVQVASTMNVSPSVDVHLAYGVAYMIPWDAGRGFDPYAARQCLDSHIDLVWSEGCIKVNEGEALPAAAGHYSRITHQIGVGVMFKF